MRRVYRQVVPRGTALCFAFVAVLALSPPALAQQEDCIQCKYADCMAGMVAHKEAIARAYDDLARKFAKVVLVEGQSVDVVDFRMISDPADRDQFYASLNGKMIVFDENVTAMVGAVGEPPGCGPMALETWTNNVLCTTDQPSLEAARKATPCRQIAVLIDTHERQHREACKVRLQAGLWNYAVGDGIEFKNVVLANLYLSPAGKAREEAKIHRMEAAAFRELHRRAKKKCERAEVEVSSQGDAGSRLAQEERVRRAAERVAVYARSLN